MSGIGDKIIEWDEKVKNFIYNNPIKYRFIIVAVALIVSFGFFMLLDHPDWQRNGIVLSLFTSGFFLFIDYFTKDG